MSNKSEVNTFEGCLGLFVLIVVAALVGAIIGGYVLSVMWGWFVVPLFNLPPLSIPYAIGINLIVSFLTQPNYKSSDKEKPSKVIAEMLMACFAPLMYLGMGWIVLQFIK